MVMRSTSSANLCILNLFFGLRSNSAIEYEVELILDPCKTVALIFLLPDTWPRYLVVCSLFVKYATIQLYMQSSISSFAYFSNIVSWRTRSMALLKFSNNITTVLPDRRSSVTLSSVETRAAVSIGRKAYWSSKTSSGSDKSIAG